jgi:hypothetical protein
MATLYITEVQSLGWVGPASNQLIHAPVMPPVAEQTVAIGSGSTPSAAFNASTRFIQVSTDEVCSIAFGANPTATAANQRMAANEVRYFAVNPGNKLAVIQNT